MGGTGTRRRAARRRRTGQPRQDLLLGRPVGAAGGAERSALLVCATQGVVPRRRRRVSAVRREGPPPRDAARVAYAEVARKRSIASSTQPRKRPRDPIPQELDAADGYDARPHEDKIGWVRDVAEGGVEDGLSEVDVASVHNDAPPPPLL